MLFTKAYALLGVTVETEGSEGLAFTERRGAWQSNSGNSNAIDIAMRSREATDTERIVEFIHIHPTIWNPRASNGTMAYLS